MNSAAVRKNVGMSSKSLTWLRVSLLTLVWGAGLAAVLLGSCPPVRAQEGPAAGLLVHGVIFQYRGGSAQVALQILETLLIYEVDRLDGLCNLSTAQKQKLQLLGQGDIARFFREVESLKRDFEYGVLRHGTVDSNLLLLAQRRLDRENFFQGGSLLLKSLPNVLSAPQLALHLARERKTRLFQHECLAGVVVGLLAQRIHLSGFDRAQFVSLVMTEVPPCPVPGQDEMRYIMIQVLELEKARPTKIPMYVGRALVGLAKEFKLPEQAIRKADSTPIEDEEDSEPNRIAPAGKRTCNRSANTWRE